MLRCNIGVCNVPGHANGILFRAGDDANVTIRAGDDVSVTLRASTGAKIVVWTEDDLYHARIADSAAPPETCLGVDLFEVLAELSKLDLDERDEAAEAMNLAAAARQRLRVGDPGHDPGVTTIAPEH
jgi:hypothetical protein